MSIPSNILMNEAPEQEALDPESTGQQPRRPNRFGIWIIALGAAAAAILVVLGLALSHGSVNPSPASNTKPSSTSVPAHPSAPVVPPAQPTAPVVPPAQPTAPVVPPAHPTAPVVPPAHPTAPANLTSGGSAN